MRFLLFLALLLSPLTANAQLTVAPGVAPLGEPIVATFTYKEEENTEVAVFWEASEGVGHLPGKEPGAIHIWAKPGVHTLRAILVIDHYQTMTVFVPDPEAPQDVTKAKLQQIRFKLSSEVQRESVEFTVEGGLPPGPTPPGPTPPGPTPPQPVDTVPFPAPGLMVVVLSEVGGSGLTEEQKAIFTSVDVYNYLRSKCTKLSDNNPGFRFLDDDYTEANQSTLLPDQLKVAYPLVVRQANGRLPWIAISDGQRGFSGPLPANVQDMMSLLRQFGG